MVILNFLAAPRAARTGRARDLGGQENWGEAFQKTDTYANLALRGQVILSTHENLTCEKSLWNTSVESYHFMIAVHLCFHECTFQKTFGCQIKCRKQALKTLSFKNKFWSFLDSSAIEFLYPCPENFISNNTITFTSIKEIIEFDILIWECRNFYVSARIQSYTSQVV